MRWRHPHTFAGGFLTAAVMLAHPWWAVPLGAAACFLAGVFCGRLWRWALQVEEAVRLKLTRDDRKGAGSPAPTPVYSVPMPKRGPSQVIPFGGGDTTELWPGQSRLDRY